MGTPVEKGRRLLASPVVGGSQGVETHAGEDRSSPGGGLGAAGSLCGRRHVGHRAGESVGDVQRQRDEVERAGGQVPYLPAQGSQRGLGEGVGGGLGDEF